MRDARHLSPPPAALTLLGHHLPVGEREMILGDLTEVFADRVDAGRRFNRLWFWTQTIAFVLGFATAPLFHHASASVPRKLLMGRLATSIRQAGRRLVFEWRYALGVILILGVGIGPASAMLSVVETVLLKPLAYSDPDRLGIVRVNIGQLQNHPGLALGEIQDLRKTEGLFDAVEAEARQSEVTLGAGDQLKPSSSLAITPGLFTMLGVSPIMGRTFSDDDVKQNAAGVVLIDYGFWQSQLGADPNVVGRQLQINGNPAEVLGVMPQGFRLVTGRAVPQPIDVYMPFRVTDFRNFWGYPTLVRVKAGVTLEQVNRHLEGLTAALVKQYPANYSDARLQFIVQPLKDDMVKTTRPALRASIVGVLLLLGIALANATALIVARLKTRERDFAIRLAVGAGRTTLMGDVLVESVIISVCGALFGAMLAMAGTIAARQLVPHTVPRWDQIAFSWNLVGYSAAFALAGLFISGLIPVWKVSRHLPWQALRLGAPQGGRAEGAGPRLLLVGAQIALTVVLAFAAVQLVRSSDRLSRVNLGFDPNVLTFRVPFDFRTYNQPEKVTALYERVRDRLRQMPGVESAGAISHLPLSGTALTDSWTTDLTKQPGWDQSVANYYSVTPGYFATMKIPIVQGRDFTDTEDTTGQHVIVIDETLARIAFPGVRDVTGRVMRLGWGIPDSQIVGVVGHVRGIDIAREVRPQIYAPFGNFMQQSLIFVVRPSGEPRHLVDAAQAAVREMNTGRAVSSFAMLTDNVSAATSTLRSVTGLVTMLAVSAGLLSAIGLYAVIAFILHQRRRATAIRSALGASPAQLVRLHMKTCGVVLIVALPVGLALAAAVAPLFSALVFGVAERDLASLTLAGVLAVIASVVGTYVPVRRAATTDPVIVLRGET
jgi:putative ABC transport system permease protein